MNSSIAPKFDLVRIKSSTYISANRVIEEDLNINRELSDFEPWNPNSPISKRRAQPVIPSARSLFKTVQSFFEKAHYISIHGIDKARRLRYVGLLLYDHEERHYSSHQLA
jgi:hypothetical protein